MPQPLGQFQTTTTTFDEVTKMVTDLNKLSEMPTKPHILERLMKASWVDLESTLLKFSRTPHRTRRHGGTPTRCSRRP